MKEQYFLGIDNGGTMSKAALFDAQGRERAVAVRRVKILSPQRGWSERCAHQMWLDTASAIREVIDKSGVEPSSIAAVACTGHGNGLYLVDSAGNPVRNGINSNDKRAVEYIERWKREGVDDEVLPKTTQTLWAAQPNALLAWIRDNEPQNFENAATIFMAKDYIRFRLTGLRRAEITDMSGTSLMNVVSGSYDQSVLYAFGLEEVQEMLPPLVESAQIAGTISADAALLTGLFEGTPVAGGMFDIDACGLSSGLLDSGQFSIVAGTWGNNQYIAEEPLVDKELFMTSRYATPGWYLMLEGSPTSAGNLEWFIDRFLSHERVSLGDTFYSTLSHWVDSIHPQHSSLIFLPFVYGCNAGCLKGGFYGFDAETGKEEMTRAVFEGVVFSHLMHIERLLAFRDYPEVIRLTGGAAKSTVWCQMFADVIGVPVEVPRGSELGALGAAMVAAVSIGYYSDIPSAVRNMSGVAHRYTPDEKRMGIYQFKYQAYKQLINQLNHEIL